MHRQYSLITLCSLLFVLSLPGTATAGRTLFQWTDEDGVTHFADKNPKTNPSNQKPSANDPDGKRSMPMPDTTTVVDFLRKTGAESVPAFCQIRNSDNPDQRSICEQYQRRALSEVESFISDPKNPHAKFIYSRCRGRWLRESPPDFFRLAQCMGVKV